MKLCKSYLYILLTIFSVVLACGVLLGNKVKDVKSEKQKQKQKYKQKREIEFFSIIMFIAIILLTRIVNGEGTCVADLSQLGMCNISTSLTFNGTYSISINTSGGYNTGAINIQANNIILDCNHSTIYGNWSIANNKVYQGIYTEKDNVTIKNCNFKNYYRGIRLATGGDNVTVMNVNASNNYYGIYGIGNRNNSLIDIFTSNNVEGIYLEKQANYYYVRNHTSRNENMSLDSLYCDYLTLTKSYYYNITNYMALSLSRSNNFKVDYSIFDINSKCIYVTNSSGGLIEHNICNNSVNNFDEWNVGIYLQDYRTIPEITKPTNNTINNNTIDNYGCIGILARGVNNLTLIKNKFNQNTDSYYSTNKIKCRNEPQSAIFISQIYKSYIPDGTIINDTYSVTDGLNSTLVTLDDNEFNSNVKMPLRTQGVNNLVQDLLSYWLREWRLSYLLDKDSFYISNSYSNLSTIDQNLNYNETMTQGIWANLSMHYIIKKDFMFFENIDDTDREIIVYNQSSALIYTLNMSLPCGDIGTLICNISLSSNNGSYILSDYNLTEGVTREHDPLSITSSSNTAKHINSSLSQMVNTSVIVNVPSCNHFESGSYRSDDGTYTHTYTVKQLKDSCTNNKLNLPLEIEPATASNILSLTYEFDDPELFEYCTNLENGFSDFGQLLAIIVLAIVFVMVIGYIMEKGLSVQAFLVPAIMVLVYVVVINIIGAIVVSYIC